MVYSGRLQILSLTLDVLGEAVTFFTVGLQPGDNYRVAALLDTPGASNHLAQLQVANEVLPMFVPSGTNQIEGFVGALSPMLTVWRKLHLEFDSMAAPPASGPEANYVAGSIAAVRLNQPATGRSYIAVSHALVPEDGGGTFDRGIIEIAGAGSFAVTNAGTMNYLNGRASTTVEIFGAPAGLTNGQPVKLYDDDDRYLANHPLYPSNLGLVSPPTPAFHHVTPFISAAQPKFAAAYLTLVDANAMGWNTQPNIVFKKAESGYSVFGTVFDNGNLQFKGTDRPEFWAWSVVFGYQSDKTDDGEPDAETPLSGTTPKTSPYLPPGFRNIPLSYSVIFLENIRDYEFGRRTASDQQPTYYIDPIRVPHIRNQYTQRILCCDCARD